jgi:hypothetical protein
MNKARHTGSKLYTSIDKIEIKGLDSNEQVNVYTVGYRILDHTLLTPLWAGIPDRERALEIIDRTITNPTKFWLPYGLPACPQPPQNSDTMVCQGVNLPWNMIVVEGMLSYGAREEAAELITRLMSAIVRNLKAENAFRRGYHADSGQGIGERHALNGLAPVGLFLNILGVRIVSPFRLALVGHNPFPWPVTVKFRGLTIMRYEKKTSIIFPDGQTITVTDPEPRIVSLEQLQG